MFEELEKRKARYEELERLLSDPKIIANTALYQRHAKELSALKGAVSLYEDYLKCVREIKDLEKEAASGSHDADFLKMARDELSSLNSQKEALSKELENSLIVEDKNASRDIIMEIRAGTGGVEAGLFAADLYRMYTKYATNCGWKTEVLSASYTEKKGIKEIIFSIQGDNVYSRLKFESGTHRVQRVPETEASGRIHTSAATVAVLPEAEEVDVEIKPDDLKIDVFRAGGKGGQHVNVTDSAVRITHVPTGLVVSCQDERSQYKNKTKALRILRTRLLEKIKVERDSKISKERKMQVGTGDRSEKIRTYNFPDSRVTDHRIGLTMHKLEDILEGDIDGLISALREAERQLKVKRA